MEDKKTDFAPGKAAKLRFQAEQLRKESGLNDREEFAAEAAEMPLTVKKLAYAEQYRQVTAPAEAAEHTAEAEQLEETEEAVTRSRTFGYIALVTALASLFLWPAVLGPAGIALGLYAFFRGNKALGAWSISLGLLAVAAYFFLVPYYA